MGSCPALELPIIKSGNGCVLTDVDGRQYLDALSGLFVVQAGYGRGDIARHPARTKVLNSRISRSGATDTSPAIRLARPISRVGSGGPEPSVLHRVPSESVETALKMIRQYHRLPRRYGPLQGDLAVHRLSRRHDGSAVGHGDPQLRTPFEPLLEGFHKTPNTNPFRPIIPDWKVPSLNRLPARSDGGDHRRRRAADRRRHHP